MYIIIYRFDQKINRLRFFMNVIATLIALFFSSMVAATSLHNIVVFGDSLSDNGNLYEFMDKRIPLSPPYYEGRFTNGRVWVEYLIKSYFPDDRTNAHLFDYAFGGAGISEESEDEALFTLTHEIDMYLLAHHNKVDPKNLFVVWIGANNYLAIPSDADKTVKMVNKGIKRELARLVKLGAKHILVMNTPDLGRTPAAVEFESQKELSDLSARHNAALADSFEQLKEEFPEVEWIYFDVEKSVNEIMDSPSEFGFSNVTDSCYDVVIEKPSKQALIKMASNIRPSKHDLCEKYMFFDLVHCTAPAHILLANRVRQLLDSLDVHFVKS